MPADIFGRPLGGGTQGPRGLPGQKGDPGKDAYYISEQYTIQSFRQMVLDNLNAGFFPYNIKTDFVMQNGGTAIAKLLSRSKITSSNFQEVDIDTSATAYIIGETFVCPTFRQDKDGRVYIQFKGKTIFNAHNIPLIANPKSIGDNICTIAVTFKPQKLSHYLQCIVSNYSISNASYRGIYLYNSFINVYGLKTITEAEITLELHVNKWYTVVISWGWEPDKTFCTVRSEDGSIFKQIMSGSDIRLSNEIQPLTIGGEIATLTSPYPFHGELSGLLVYNNQFHGTNLKGEFRERIENTMMDFIAIRPT